MIGSKKEVIRSKKEVIRSKKEVIRSKKEVLPPVIRGSMGYSLWLGLWGTCAIVYMAIGYGLCAEGCGLWAMAKSIPIPGVARLDFIV